MRALPAYWSGGIADLYGPGVAKRVRGHAFEEEEAERAKGRLVSGTHESAGTIDRRKAALPSVIGIRAGIARAVAAHASRRGSDARVHHGGALVGARFVRRNHAAGAVREIAARSAAALESGSHTLPVIAVEIDIAVPGVDTHSFVTLRLPRLVHTGAAAT